ncbi:Permease of the drug/metabolite transporter (DMT) superfamily [Rhizobiales bacterium GAS113]|nr:Permease of the drug/metabolite transporter (DMT) superfamily [Rhizobiales bacterium GAS113]
MIATIRLSRSTGMFVLAQMLVCSFLWANSFLLIKLIGSDVPPLTLTAIRGAMGALLIAAWLGARGRSILPRGREWRDWAVLGALQGWIPNTLTAYALSEISAALSSMIQACAPLIVAVLAHLLFDEERLSRPRAIGVLTAFGGIGVLIGADAVSGGQGSLAGILAMVVTAVSYALGSLYVRSIPKADPARLALGQQAFSGLPALILVLVLDGGAALTVIPSHFGALAALGIFATALPILLFMNILRTAGPTLGSMNGYLTPIWTALLGTCLLNESIQPREAIGGSIALAGLLIVAMTKRSGSKMPSSAARSHSDEMPHGLFSQLRPSL